MLFESFLIVSFWQDWINITQNICSTSSGTRQRTDSPFWNRTTMANCLLVTKRYLMKLIYPPGVTPLPLGMTIVLFIILVGTFDFTYYIWFDDGRIIEDTDNFWVFLKIFVIRQLCSFFRENSRSNVIYST